MPESFRPEGAKCLKINKRQKKLYLQGQAAENQHSVYTV